MNTSIVVDDAIGNYFCLGEYYVCLCGMCKLKQSSDGLYGIITMPQDMRKCNFVQKFLRTLEYQGFLNESNFRV